MYLGWGGVCLSGTGFLPSTVTSSHGGAHLWCQGAGMWKAGDKAFKHLQLYREFVPSLRYLRLCLKKKKRQRRGGRQEVRPLVQGYGDFKTLLKFVYMHTQAYSCLWKAEGGVRYPWKLALKVLGNKVLSSEKAVRAHNCPDLTLTPSSLLLTYNQLLRTHFAGFPLL